MTLHISFSAGAHHITAATAAGADVLAEKEGGREGEEERERGRERRRRREIKRKEGEKG